MMVQILLADDHHIVRQGLEFMIEDILDEFEIIHAASIQDIKEQFQTQALDFAILDAQLPDGNCLDILTEISQQFPEVKIMVFSSFDEEIYALRFIEAGADGFLSKLSSEEEIKTALAQLFKNGHYHSPLTQALLKIQQHQPNALNPLNQLSERELEIAKLYAKGFENLEIANELSIKQNTVSTYKKRIYDKLGIDKLIDLIDLMKKYHDY